jgi:hypothetical protein
MSYAYMASPYSDPDLMVMERRYIMARRACAWLLNHDHFVYSPIVHCHEIAVHHRLPRDADYWFNYNMAMLRPADHFIILAIPGWITSKGLQRETKEVLLQQKAIFLLRYEEEREGFMLSTSSREELEQRLGKECLTSTPAPSTSSSSKTE